MFQIIGTKRKTYKGILKIKDDIKKKILSY